MFPHLTPERILHSKTQGLILVRIKWVPLQRPLKGSRMHSSIKGEPTFNARYESGRPLTVIEFKNYTGISFCISSGLSVAKESVLCIIFCSPGNMLSISKLRWSTSSFFQERIVCSENHWSDFLSGSEILG